MCNFQNLSFEIWIFGIHFCKMDPRQNRGRRPDTKRPRPVAAGDFWQSHRAPMPLSKFFSRRRQCPWCGASVGATGSAPRALACCPWSVMRSLCWNHWFRPLCACVLPDYLGFIPDLFRIYSHPSPFQEERRQYCKKCVRNANRIYGGFMSDLFTFWAVQGGAAEKKGAINPIPRLAWGQTGGRIYDPQNSRKIPKRNIVPMV